MPWWPLQALTASCLMNPHRKICTLTSAGSMSLVSDIPLTDLTALDLTQKAEKGMPLHSSTSHYVPPSPPPYLTSWDVWAIQVQLLFSTFQHSCTSSHNTPWTSLCNPSAFPTLAHFSLICQLHAQTLKGNFVHVFLFSTLCSFRNGCFLWLCGLITTHQYEPSCHVYASIHA